MSRHRFFLDGPVADTPGIIDVPLSPDELHHARRVLRLQPGEEIVVVDPAGDAWAVAIDSVDADGLTGRRLSHLPRVREPHITLVQGICKGAAMDEIIQHAVELGVERIVPLLTERTVVRLEASKADARVARWQRIAESAARQSQQARVPKIEAPMALECVAEALTDSDVRIVLWEEGSAGSLPSVVAAAIQETSGADSRVALIVGPEGGLAAEEVAAMRETGALVASLGTSILRAQTAALAAVTLASYALGGLGACSTSQSPDNRGGR